MNSLPDEDLVRLFNEGQTEAFNHLYSRYEGQVFRMVMLRLQNPQLAEDVVQETFLKVFLHLSKFRGDSKFYVWVYRIASNICVDMLRRPGENSRTFCHPNPLQLVPEDSDPGSIEQDMRRQELIERFDQAFHELPKTLQEIMIMCQIGGMSHKEVAHALDVPLGTTLSRLHRARMQIREKLAPYLKEVLN